jgi:hypothetical protein
MSNQPQAPIPPQDDNPQPDSRRGAVAGYFLMTALRHESQLEDCMMAGRKNCAPLDIPANKP